MVVFRIFSLIRRKGPPLFPVSRLMPETLVPLRNTVFALNLFLARRLFFLFVSPLFTSTFPGFSLRYSSLLSGPSKVFPPPPPPNIFNSLSYLLCHWTSGSFFYLVRTTFPVWSRKQCFQAVVFFFVPRDEGVFFGRFLPGVEVLRRRADSRFSLGLTFLCRISVFLHPVQSRSFFTLSRGLFLRPAGTRQTLFLPFPTKDSRSPLRNSARILPLPFVFFPFKRRRSHLLFIGGSPCF